MYRFTGFWTLLLVNVLLFACHKETAQGTFEKGQIALTFDDASIENWHQYLPLLDSLNIKATFYVSHYHSFNARKKALLKEIALEGHEVAYHTANHPDLVKEVAKKGLAYVEEVEIKKDLLLMQKDGYSVTNFAYPYGSHNTILNTCLLRTFKSVRVVTNAHNYQKSLTKAAGDWKVLYGLAVDNNSSLSDSHILSYMDDAQLLHSCLILFAHQINNKATAWQISLERLKLIAREANKRNLRFVTINELTQ